MRLYLCLLAVAAACFADSRESVTLHGTLTIQEGKPATVETIDRQTVQLDGDAGTLKVLGDKRLNGFQIQAKGRYTAPGRFTVDPLHTRALMVRKDGGLKMVSYWCDVCSIRAYIPGPCPCCQDDMNLSLINPPDHPDHK